MLHISHLRPKRMSSNHFFLRERMSSNMKEKTASG
jgi:hypothetical protein